MQICRRSDDGIRSSATGQSRSDKAAIIFNKVFPSPTGADATNPPTTVISCSAHACSHFSRFRHFLLPRAIRESISPQRHARGPREYLAIWISIIASAVAVPPATGARRGRFKIRTRSWEVCTGIPLGDGADIARESALPFHVDGE